MAGWYQVKLFVEHASGVSMDALHVLVGFMLFIVAVTVVRRGLGSFVPWSAVLVVELANELYDLSVERWPSLATQLGESTKDIMLTMALPTLLLAIARWRPGWIADAGSAGNGP